MNQQPKPAQEFTAFSLQDTVQSIASRFTSQAEKYPHKTAIQASDREITYQELDLASNRVANAILARWGADGQPVATLLSQGIESITVMLGVFKTGFYYIPIDPSTLTDRDRHLLNDEKVTCVITSSACHEQVTQFTDLSHDILDINTLGSGTPDTLPVVDINPDSPALILYTSGSTGRPKGAVHSHRSFLHIVLRHTNTFCISHTDRQSQLYQVNAYAAMRDTLNALLNGASLHLYSVRDQGVNELAEWLQKQQITIYCSAVSVFRHLAHILKGTGKFPALRLVKLGGEVTYKTDIELFKTHFPAHCLVHCGYSSTEIGVARHYFADKDTDIQGNTVPLGYTVDDMEVQILDEYRQPVKTGSEGEIAVKSRYIALGYWQQDELTAASFITSSEDPAVRTYLTGDMGLIQTNGCLIHRGRKDFQVKIRGNRVDVIEIETALVELEPVREAAVVVCKNSLDENELVAFCVCPGVKQVEPAWLRGELSEKIPAYMIPSRFEFPDSLPQTQSGKLNRKKLQQYERQPPPESSHIPPRTPVELEITAIWKTLLQTDVVAGIHDNFFESGGHSLLATRLIARINDNFGTSLPLRTVFEAADIHQLSIRVVEQLSLQAE